MSAKQTDKFSPTRWCATESSVRSASPANITSLPATRSTGRRQIASCTVFSKTVETSYRHRHYLRLSLYAERQSSHSQESMLPNKVLRFRGTPYARFQGRI